MDSLKSSNGGLPVDLLNDYMKMALNDENNGYFGFDQVIIEELNTILNEQHGHAVFDEIRKRIKSYILKLKE